MYNIVCVKYGDKYHSEYVNKLYGMVKRNLSLPHKFYCFTENNEGIRPEVEIRPLEDQELDGWWHKLTLFKPNVHDLKGRILFLDLDIIIVDSIDCFFDCLDPFVIIKDWNSRGNNIFWNSSVFSFEVGSFPFIWERFIENLGENIKTPGGDQRWILNTLPKDRITTWPEEWCRSFKYDCKDGIPNGSKMIIFHGRPNPHEAENWTYRSQIVKSKWIAEYWKE